MHAYSNGTQTVVGQRFDKNESISLLPPPIGERRTGWNPAEPGYSVEKILNNQEEM